MCVRGTRSWGTRDDQERHVGRTWTAETHLSSVPCEEMNACQCNAPTDWKTVNHFGEHEKKRRIEIGRILCLQLQNGHRHSTARDVTVQPKGRRDAKQSAHKDVAWIVNSN